jgi:hypothetical protein
MTVRFTVGAALLALSLQLYVRIVVPVVAVFTVIGLVFTMRCPSSGSLQLLPGSDQAVPLNTYCGDGPDNVMVGDAPKAAPMKAASNTNVHGCHLAAMEEKCQETL